jgi:hypothetical protein
MMRKLLNVTFEVFTAVTIKNTVFWEERIASIFRVEEIRKIYKRGTSVSRWLQPLAIRSSETSFYTISTQRHIQEDGILQVT